MKDELGEERPSQRSEQKGCDSSFRVASVHDPASRTESRRHLLFLVHRIPYPPDKGDRIRSYHLLANLARLGEVDLAFLTDGPIAMEDRAALDRLCRRVAAVHVSRRGRWVRAAASLARGRSLTEGLFESPTLRATIERWLSETKYDTIVSFSSGVLPYLLGRGLESRLIVELVDVDSQKWFDYAGRAAGPKAALFRLEGRRVRALELAAGTARAVVLATEVEAVLYRRLCPAARVESIPNGVDLDYFRPLPAVEDSGCCVFVGQLDYRANVLGLEWFCRAVWPAIRRRLPAARFQIVGRNPVGVVQRLGLVSGVEVVGTVPDVRPYLAAARVVVVPLPVARGVQNKVLEAMAMGRALVVSPPALDGLGAVPGRDVLAAGAPDEWEQQTVALWDDPQRRDELGRGARHYVERNHRWESSLERFNSLVVGAEQTRDAAPGG